MKTVFSLGSNMGDPFAHLRDAVRLIAETPGIHDVVAVAYPHLPLPTKRIVEITVLAL